MGYGKVMVGKREFDASLGKVNSSIADIELNIKQFGAKLDGATDDSDSLISAISYSKTHGNIPIDIPKGSLRVTKKIVIPKYPYIFNLFGKDLSQSTILFDTADSCFAMEETGQQYRFNLQNFKAQTTVANRFISMAADSYLGGIPRMENISFIGFKDTVAFLQKAFMIRIKNLYFYSCKDGIFGTMMNASTIEGLTFFTISGKGLVMEETFGSTINTIVAETLGEEALWIKSGSGINVSGAYFDGCGTSLTGNYQNKAFRIGDKSTGAYATNISITGGHGREGKINNIDADVLYIEGGKSVTLNSVGMNVEVPDAEPGVNIEAISIFGEIPVYFSTIISNDHKNQVYRLNNMQNKLIPITWNDKATGVPGESYHVLGRVEARYTLNIFSSIAHVIGQSYSPSIGIEVYNVTDSILLYSEYADKLSGTDVQPLNTFSFSKDTVLEMRIKNNGTEPKDITGSITFTIKNV